MLKSILVELNLVHFEKELIQMFKSLTEVKELRINQKTIRGF